MARKQIADMAFEEVYDALLRKAERKGRTKAETDEVICWLSGYEDLSSLKGKTYGEFISQAPAWNPHAEEIRGTVCGIRVETIEDPFLKRVRQLDKLIDELAKGKPMEKIFRGG